MVRVVDAVVAALDPVFHVEGAVVGIVALVEADMPLAHDDFRLVQAIAGLAAARPLRPPLAAIGAGLAHVVELAAKLEQRAGFGEAKGARRAAVEHVAHEAGEVADGGGGRRGAGFGRGRAGGAGRGGEGGGDGVGRGLAGRDTIPRAGAGAEQKQG